MSREGLVSVRAEPSFELSDCPNLDRNDEVTGSPKLGQLPVGLEVEAILSLTFHKSLVIITRTMRQLEFDKKTDGKKRSRVELLLDDTASEVLATETTERSYLEKRNQ